jgi:hypothetical protein
VRDFGDDSYRSKCGWRVINAMDPISIWLHNSNVDHTLDRLRIYVEPSTCAELLKFLVAEEDRLGTGPEQLENTARRVRQGMERITRILNIVEGLVERGLMDQEQLSRHYRWSPRCVKLSDWSKNATRLMRPTNKRKTG